MTPSIRVAPTVVRKTIAEIKEAPLPPKFEAGGVAGGVPGGVAGGSRSDRRGNHRGNRSMVTKTGPAKRSRVRDGRLRHPRLINRVDPTYPTLAKQTQAQGV